MTTTLPQLVLDALDEAESFINGFVGDEMQDGVPEKILETIAAARLPWRDVDWKAGTGDTMLEIFLRMGQDHGSVRVRMWGEKLLVEAFLPGRHVCNEGDTPKTEPEQTEWADDRLAAAGAVFNMMAAAKRAGWTELEN